MSTPQWFAEFERQEAMREERIDIIRAAMSDNPKPPKYEAREFPVNNKPSPDLEYGVFDTFAQAFCIDESYSSKAQAAVAAGRMNAAYTRAMAP
jgi:hypothetical protein